MVTRDLIAQATKAARRDLKTCAAKLQSARAVAEQAQSDLRAAIITHIRIGGKGSAGRFADEFGMSRAYVSEICSGGRGIGDDLANKITGVKK